MNIKEMTKETREASLDLGVEFLVAYAEVVGYKAEEPEECVRWELAKAFHKELKEKKNESTDSKS